MAGADRRILDLLGIELQRISLGALIIALGLLVDDAIISVEMYSNRALPRGGALIPVSGLNAKTSCPTK